MVCRRRDDRPPLGRNNGVAAGEQTHRGWPGRNGQRRTRLLAFRLFERIAGLARRAGREKAYEELETLRDSTVKFESGLSLSYCCGGHHRDWPVDAEDRDLELVA